MKEAFNVRQFDTDLEANTAELLEINEHNVIKLLLVDNLVDSVIKTKENDEVNAGEKVVVNDNRSSVTVIIVDINRIILKEMVNMVDKQEIGEKESKSNFKGELNL